MAAGEGGEFRGGGSGGAIIFCRGGNFCDKQRRGGSGLVPRQNFFYPTRRVYLARNSC